MLQMVTGESYMTFTVKNYQLSEPTELERNRIATVQIEHNLKFLKTAKNNIIEKHVFIEWRREYQKARYISQLAQKKKGGGKAINQSLAFSLLLISLDYDLKNGNKRGCFEVVILLDLANAWVD